MIAICIQQTQLQKYQKPQFSFTHKISTILGIVKNLIREEEGQIIMIGQRQLKFSFENQLGEFNKIPFFCNLIVNETNIITETSINSYQIVSRVKKYGFTKFLYFLNQWNMESDYRSKIVWKSKNCIISIIQSTPNYHKNFQILLCSSLKETWIQFNKFLLSFIKTTSYLFQLTPSADWKFKSLNCLKTLFEQNRMQRKKSNPVYLMGNCENSSPEIKSNSPFSVKSEQTEIYQRAITPIKVITQSYKNFNPILRYISIKQKCQCTFGFWKVKSGYNCTVKSCFLTYENLFLKSIDKETSQLLINANLNKNIQQNQPQLSQKPKQKKKIKIIDPKQKRQTQKQVQKQNQIKNNKLEVRIQKGVFIEKQALAQDQTPFKNQLSIIKLLRNSRCPYIASFYHSNIQQVEFLQTSSLYLDFYQRPFSCQQSCANKKTLIQKLIEGINFLGTQKICHRDLKPANIMIGDLRNPKIIDFGSSSSFYGSIRAQNTSRLRTTIRYNKFYACATPQTRRIFTKDQFQKHQLYDLYAFGMIVKQMVCNTRFQQEMGKFMRLNYDYIAQKCTEDNPDDRLTPQQIIAYFKQIQRCQNIIDIANGYS